MTLVKRTKNKILKIDPEPYNGRGSCKCQSEILGYKFFVTENAEYCNIWYNSKCKYPFICWMVSQIFKKCSSHTQFGELSGWQDQGTKEILSCHKKILIFF